MKHGRAGAHSSPGQPGAEFRRRVLALIRRVPRGRVVTYGQIAVLAGYPRQARRVGQVLGATPASRAGREQEQQPVPWQRVINAQGRVSPRAPSPERPLGARERHQQDMLRREGVRFVNGQVDLAVYRWWPQGAAPAGFRQQSSRRPAPRPRQQTSRQPGRRQSKTSARPIRPAHR